MTIPGYFSEEEQAKRLGKSVRTLRIWRQRGIGPAWTTIGKTIIYEQDNDRRWLKSQERQPVRTRRTA
jgi:hypothetical protein